LRDPDYRSPAEHYVRLVAEHDLRAGTPRRSISQSIREIWADIPEEVRAPLPADGASQVAHYVYRINKKKK